MGGSLLTMRRRAALILMLGKLSVAFPFAVQGDIIALPSAPPIVKALSLQPYRGMSKDAVAQQYGEPLSRAPGVGNPPISRWDYPQFSVYFEYQHVIHTVVHER